MKFALQITFLLAVCLVFAPASLTSQIDWYKINFTLFEIYYTETDQNLAEDLAIQVEKEYADLSQQLGLRYTQPVRIFLSPSDQVFHQLTGQMIPHWGAGVADPDKSLIFLKSPNYFRHAGKFARVLRHELVHVLIGQSLAPSQHVPKWFHEGMAIYFSYDADFSGGKAISKALLSNSIIPLDEIDGMLDFHSEKARLAYEESYSVILFIEDKLGFRALVELVQAVRSEPSFDVAIRDHYGQDIYEFEKDWYNYIENKYRWRFLLDFETFLWIFILLLFIFVFVAIRMRNRKIMRRWDEEERWVG
ncbi:MAG: peptidase MA family metallohydrolase [bacterium]